MAEDKNNIVSGKVQGQEEEQAEFSLRPQTLNEYLGQKRVKKKWQFILRLPKKG
ncbi:hypothetical protein SDC49_06260 [Lactobacillus sp. R2/2]|nr:hypothetical protein [Lactobacillus sp. R2/2]